MAFNCYGSSVSLFSLDNCRSSIIVSHVTHYGVYLPVYSDGLYHIDQKSMTGIIVGVSIALACIVMCAMILINKGRPRY